MRKKKKEKKKIKCQHELTAWGDGVTSMSLAERCEQVGQFSDLTVQEMHSTKT